MAQILNNNNEVTFGSIIGLLQDAADRTGSSLFQYTRKSTVNSRVFIDSTLQGEDILNPLMLNIMNLYAGLIMTAVNLNQYISSTRTIRDSLSVVATEDFKVKFADEIMGEVFAGCKVPSTMASSLSSGSPYTERVPRNPRELGNAIADIWVSDRKEEEVNDDKDPDGRKASSSTITTKDDTPLPSGRIIQVELDSDNTGKFKVNILLQLHPIYVPTEVSQQFIAINFRPSLKQRWLQMTSGEISFFTDFLLGNDLRRKRLNALRKDKTGVLSDMIDTKENAVSNMWLKLAQITPDRQNIANSILIYERRNFDKACNSSSINFKSFNSRQKFFIGTMSMMVAVVDTNYNKVDMYYNGIPMPSTFTFDQLKKNAKTESTDILAMMKNYAQGMSPKF
jgi:hypothetical protein